MGDNKMMVEVVKVATRCLDSKEKVSFVVALPTYGISTQLPMTIANMSEKGVICVQPNAEVARRHANYMSIQSDDVQKTESYLDSEFKEFPRQRFHVAYVSYRWLWRMIAFEGISRGIEVEVRAIVLDEVHGRTTDQEIAHVAVRAVLEGKLERPRWWTEETKIICASAYPQADPFSGLFGLSDQQIRDQTVTIEPGKDYQRKQDEVRSQYLKDDLLCETPAAYHEAAKDIVASILRERSGAKILVVALGGSRTGSRVVREMTVGGGARVLDLSRHDLEQINEKTSDGRVIVMETDYTARARVEGVTDVVCPPFRIIEQYDRASRKVLSTCAKLRQWEVDFLRNHLDSRSNLRMIHHVFTRTTELAPNGGPLCFRGDCLDYMLGVIKLLGTREARQGRLPMTIPQYRDAGELLRLNCDVLQLEPWDGGDGLNSEIRTDDRTELLLEFLDELGLDCRAASFLSYVWSRTANASEGGFDGVKAADIRTLGLMMVAFKDNPILYPIDPSEKADPRSLGLEIAMFKFFYSDAMVNAAFWAKWRKEGLDALPSLDEWNWGVDRHAFKQATKKVEKRKYDETYKLQLKVNPLMLYVMVYGDNMTLYEPEKVGRGIDLQVGVRINNNAKYFCVDMDAIYCRWDDVVDKRRVWACVSHYEEKGIYYGSGITWIATEIMKPWFLWKEK
ncbi:hypothetical protein F5Y02DRAFT_427281 [Annulohypoxylon stygium]|nr:hypothetical protein F5Y02DRAFT_427281 [Annulohypoxylon stygium]